MANQVATPLPSDDTLGFGNYIGVGYYLPGTQSRLVLTTCFTVDEQIQRINEFFNTCTDGQNSVMRAITFITTLQKDDDAGMAALINTTLKIMSVLYPQDNIQVKILNNPQVCGHSSSAPLPRAQALFAGAMQYICATTNPAGIMCDCGVFSLSVMTDLRAKQPDGNSANTTCIPGAYMYFLETDGSGRPLTGSALTEAIFSAQSDRGYLAAACYGVRRGAIETDANGLTKPVNPNVDDCCEFDQVGVTRNPDFSYFPRDAHGEFMALPYLTTTYGPMVGGDGCFAEASCIYRCLVKALTGIEMPAKNELLIGITTTNADKVRELGVFFPLRFKVLINEEYGPNGREPNPAALEALSQYVIRVKSLPYTKADEPQDLDAVKCLSEKAQSLRCTVAQACAWMGFTKWVADDTSFCLDALMGAPGTFYKSHAKQMENIKGPGEVVEEAGYNRYMCDVAKTAGVMTATAVTVFFVGVPTRRGIFHTQVVKGDTLCLMPSKPQLIRGKKAFGWDPAAIPAYKDARTGKLVPYYTSAEYPGGLTFSQLTDEQMEPIKPRGRAASDSLRIVLNGICGAEQKQGHYTKLDTQSAKKVVDQLNTGVATAKHVFNTAVSNGASVATAAKEASKAGAVKFAW